MVKVAVYGQYGRQNVNDISCLKVGTVLNAALNRNIKCNYCKKEISLTTKMGYRSENSFWIEKGFCNQICAIKGR